jgi:CBS domain containing-hemolysin-like protein
LLNFAEKAPGLFVLLRSVPTEKFDAHARLDSREELQHLVSESEDVLTADEKKLIVHSLSFADQRVESVMTPKSMIKTVKKSEFLGPLVLSELHEIGHSRLPVIAGDIDHVVGILHTNDLLSLDRKQSVTAEKAMEPKVYYIRDDQTLQHALAAFLRTHHHLFIVVNEFRETVGLITIEDVIEELIGREIIDEFEGHDDLRTVALRNPNDNNSPDSHQDV